MRAVAPQSIRLQKTDAKDQITNIDCPESIFLWKKDRQDLTDSPKNGREFFEIGPKISQIWKDQVKM